MSSPLLDLDEPAVHQGAGGRPSDPSRAAATAATMPGQDDGAVVEHARSLRHGDHVAGEEDVEVGAGLRRGIGQAVAAEVRPPARDQAPGDGSPSPAAAGQPVDEDDARFPLPAPVEEVDPVARLDEDEDRRQPETATIREVRAGVAHPYDRPRSARGPHHPPPFRSRQRQGSRRSSTAPWRIIPPPFREALDEVAIVIDDEPSAAQRRHDDLGPDDDLYGLIARAVRGRSTAPIGGTRITLFRLALDPDDLADEMPLTVRSASSPITSGSTTTGSTSSASERRAARAARKLPAFPGAAPRSDRSR